MDHAKLPTRERIIKASAALFYGEGIKSTSMDAVSAKAGVTKRTLYYHFESKDALVEAYLLSRDQPTLNQYKNWFNESPGTVAEKIEGIFQAFAAAADNPKWKGCGFLRTSAELAGTPGHPAMAAGAMHKKGFETWICDVLTEDGVADPEISARQILLLLDGAASVMLVHRDRAYVEAAGVLAKEVVEKRR